jgi:hypothetical protein
MARKAHESCLVHIDLQPGQGPGKLMKAI